MPCRYTAFLSFGLGFLVNHFRTALGRAVSQSVFINEDIYRINKLATTDKALYRFYVADKSILPIYLRELS